MKLRHLIGIFAFLTSFAVSVMLVGSPVSTFSRTKCFDRSRTTMQTPSFENTKTQKQIREFLEKDRQTGIELSRDKVNFSKVNNAFDSEKTATNILIKKMQAVNCDGLPADFCAAWNKHREAWETMAYFQNERQKLSNPILFGIEWEQILNREISRTYDAMLETARRHGVDFRN